jgi:sugar phosphate isomerase/epimerase
MQLGFLTENIADIEKASRLGFDSIELNTSALGKAVEAPLDKDKIAQVEQLREQHAISITALAYYDMAFNPPPSHVIATTYTRVFDAAERLGIHIIARMKDLGADDKFSIHLFIHRCHHDRWKATVLAVLSKNNE